MSTVILVGQVVLAGLVFAAALTALLRWVDGTVTGKELINALLVCVLVSVIVGVAPIILGPR